MPKWGNWPLSSLEIAITSRCNLRCKHCYQGDDVKIKVKELSFKTLKKLCTEAQNLGISHIILTGGELFTHPEIYRLLDYVSQKNFYVTIATNGTLISEKAIAILKRIKNRLRAVVSLDGFKKNHDKRRGKGTFKASLLAIRRLIKARIGTRVNCTIDKNNIFYIKRFIKFLEKVGVKSIFLIGIGAHGNALKNKEGLFLSDQRMYAKLCVLYRKYLETRKTMKRCAALKYILSINFNGTVYPCNMFRDYELLPLGNIKKEGLLKIYKRAMNKSVLKKLYNLNIRQLGRCTKCEYFEKCKGGCRARAFKYSGDLYGPDPFACFIFKKKLERMPNYLMWGHKSI